MQQTPVTDAMEITYNSLSKEGTVNMAFHQVFAEAANSELSSLLGASKAVNVVAPVWFRLNDNAGGFASILPHPMYSRLIMQVWMCGLYY